MRSPTSLLLPAFLALTGPVLLATCERKEPPGAAITPAAGSARAITSTASPPSASITPASPVASAPASSSARAADAGPPIDWKNEALPAQSGPEWDASGRALLDAIIGDDAEVARGFFFPREPFTPLKDATDPDRYWQHLYGAYGNDVHKLHRRHRDWSKVQYERMEAGSPPKWVPPGDEANKIGYHRSWGTRVRYRLDGQLYTVKIHTVISWQGRWYITHLLPWKK